MGFKLPKGCREYFSGIVDKSDEKKLSTWFDAYYLCLMVGFAQAKVDKDIKLESEDFNDDFPLDYQERVYNWFLDCFRSPAAKY